MRISLQLLKDHGLSGDALTIISTWFEEQEADVLDYDETLETLINSEYLVTSKLEELGSSETHSYYVTWFQGLVNFPSVLTYFNDHSLERVWRLDSDREFTNYDELVNEATILKSSRVKAAKTISNISGVVDNPDGTKTFKGFSFEEVETIDPEAFDAFEWFNQQTGTQMRSLSPTLAVMALSLHYKEYEIELQMNPSVDQKITNGGYEAWTPTPLEVPFIE